MRSRARGQIPNRPGRYGEDDLLCHSHKPAVADASSREAKTDTTLCHTETAATALNSDEASSIGTEKALSLAEECPTDEEVLDANETTSSSLPRDQDVSKEDVDMKPTATIPGFLPDITTLSSFPHDQDVRNDNDDRKPAARIPDSRPDVSHPEVQEKMTFGEPLFSFATFPDNPFPSTQQEVVARMPGTVDLPGNQEKSTRAPNADRQDEVVCTPRENDCAIRSKIPRLPVHSGSTPGAMWMGPRSIADGSSVFDNISSSSSVHTPHLVSATLVESESVDIPLEAPVEIQEALAVNEDKLKRRRLLVASVFVVVALATIIGLAAGLSGDDSVPQASVPAPSPTAPPRPTLERVTEEGILRCGVSDRPNLSFINNETGKREGFEVDLVSGLDRQVGKYLYPRDIIPHEWRVFRPVPCSGRSCTWRSR